MPTDRELLELAAKAAGYEITWGWRNSEGVLLYRDTAFMRGRPWNPLENHGQTFRLAFTLRISIEYSPDFYSVHALRRGEKEDSPCANEIDDMAGVCRAVVRAAAEIGRLV